jgi:cellulose biosynthesis protein BcsQ
MSIPVIIFFNNKGGFGKTTLVYHLSWSFADLGRKVLAADLDPQANLTASFLPDDQMEELWPEGPHRSTVYGCIEPLKQGTDDIPEKPYTIEIDDRLHLLPGDLDLSRFEDELSQQWPRCLDRDGRAFRVTSAFWRMLQKGAQQVDAELILVDVGPTVGAINRAALVAADYLVIPAAPDIFSLQDIKIIGTIVQNWRKQWKERRKCSPLKNLDLPVGGIKPLGYIFMQHAVRENRPVKAYEQWVKRIPEVYAEEIAASRPRDTHCLGLVKNYRSLIHMSMEARKPMFHLLPADGALGSHYRAVQEAGENFQQLAVEIEKRYKEKK